MNGGVKMLRRLVGFNQRPRQKVFFLNTKLLKLSTVWGALFPAGGIKAECSHARHFFQVGSRKRGCF